MAAPSMFARSTRATALAAVLALAVGVLCFFGGHEARNLAAEPSSTSPSSSSAAATPSALVRATARPATPPASAAPAALAAKVAALLAPLLSVSSLGTSYGSFVADAQTGTTLDDHLSGTPFAPASTTKLMTAAAILSVAGPDDRFTTTVRAGASPGQIVLVGGGDPTLSAAKVGRDPVYRSAGRLSALAAQVRKALSGGTVTSILVDDSRFSGPVEAPGWQPADVPSSYESAITPLMVDGGLPAGGGAIRSAQPDLQAGEALAALLGVPSAQVIRGAAPSGAKQLGAVRSAPMLDLVEQMLKDSDNVIAELLGREVARREHLPASFAGTVTAVRGVLAKVGVTSGLDLVDASGLSVTDRVTPAALVALLGALVGDKYPRLAGVINAMPVAGWDGTLAGRFATGRSKSGAGAVRAKTGTIDGVVTLAGIVRDASGRLLLFAFMTRGVPDIAAGEVAMDTAAAALARCGCH